MQVQSACACAIPHLSGVHEVQDGGELHKSNAGEIDERNLRVLAQHVQEEAGAGRQDELW